MTEDSEHGHLGHDGLARAGGGSQQHVVVRVVQHVEELRLDRVEVLEWVQLLQLRVVQRRHRQRLQVEQVRVRRVPVGQDQVLERDRVRQFGGQPPVADDAHVVLRRQRLEDWNREHHHLRTAAVAGWPKQEDSVSADQNNATKQSDFDTHREDIFPKARPDFDLNWKLVRKVQVSEASVQLDWMDTVSTSF